MNGDTVGCSALHQRLCRNELPFLGAFGVKGKLADLGKRLKVGGKKVHKLAKNKGKNYPEVILLHNIKPYLPHGPTLRGKSIQQS